MATKKVVIVGPSDVEAELATLREVLDIANELLHGDVQMEVWFWRTEGRPGMHVDGAQGLADEQMRISEADLVVGVFWGRLGTPVSGDESGTAHELRRAVEAWRERRKPEIFLYFCNRPQPMSALRDRTNLRQLTALSQFREALPKEVVHRDFETQEGLRSDFNRHLGRWLNSKRMAPRPTSGSEETEALFSAPDASRALPRKGQVRAVKAALLRAPIVCLDGISGSGKTLLAAQYATPTHLLPAHRGGCLWYDMPAGGTLEEMLGAFGQIAGPEDSSVAHRVKFLLTNLRLRQKLLVVENLHLAEPRSFDVLVAMAVRQSIPASVLVLSRSAVSNLDAENINIQPWTTPETRGLLNSLGIAPMHDGLYEKLRRATGGLPLAIKLFATLVKLGNGPERLLAGDLARSDRTSDWYQEIEEALSPVELSLLRYFSLAEPYITEPVLRRAHKKLPNVSEATPAFFSLQHLLLVEPRGPARWVVHPFVAEHALNATPEKDLRNLLNDLSDFSWAGVDRLKPPQIGHSALVAGIRACRYAQRAGNYQRAQQIINRLSSPAKRLGHYRTLKGLCQAQIAATSDRNAWVAYHLAHCEMILGDAQSAYAMLRALEIHNRGSALAYAAARVLAEARSELGQRSEAIAELRRSLSNAPEPARNAISAYNYARSTLAKLLIDDDALAEAHSIASDLARNARDGQTLAVVMVHLARIDARNNPKMAILRFQSAAAKFKSVGDRRGRSWALRGLSEAFLARSEPDIMAARGAVRMAIQSARQIGEATDEYVQWLERVRHPMSYDPVTLSLVDNELARVGIDLELSVT
jgi:tetratricopeptide (TPR) repeat protein